MSLSVHIRKRVGDFQLSADLEHPGGITGILGASGCGKSLTLKAVAGIVKPDAGRIVLDGKVLYDSEKRICLKPQQREVGYLFQNYALFPNMTVEKNILCGLRREKDRRRRLEKMEEMLEWMNLSGQRKLYPHQLSGGQQQRTALARMLVSGPKLLLLDEPFSALDAYLREQLQIQVKEILGRFGRDVLLVSHSRDEIYYLCGRTAIMHQGRILKTDGTGEIFADPGTWAGAALTGCKNIAAARKTGEYEVEVPEWGVRLRAARPVGEKVCAVGLRAHYFRPGTGENSFPVICSSRREEPFEMRILFRFGGQQEGSPDLWWRLPKSEAPGVMPERLGIAPENVLLLYPE